jgi:hypothetical protein
VFALPVTIAFDDVFYQEYSCKGMPYFVLAWSIIPGA